jgi:type II secretory pathway pseudopilin PulG
MARISKTIRANNEKGFSFLTVLVVVLMLSMLTGSLFLLTGPAQSVGQSDVTFQRVDVLQSALRLYKVHHANTAPATLDALVTLTGAACTMNTTVGSPGYRKLQGWCGPYVNVVFTQDSNQFKTDGWGTLFQYDTVTLRSCGPDRTCGNADDLTFNSF